MTRPFSIHSFKCLMNLTKVDLDKKKKKKQEKVEYYFEKWVFTENHERSHVR